MTKPSGPIGIFDSGIGGLTVFKEIYRLLPQYDYIYLGDNARVPYGTRSYETVYQYTKEGIWHLFSRGCRLVIIACNSASAKALRTIQQKDLPLVNGLHRVLGVIRPTTEHVSHITKTGHVGVLATTGTVISQSYVIEIQKLTPSIHVFQQACPLWVPLVESNEHETEGANFFIKKYLEGLLIQSKKIDTIILGCTHYPLLQKKIEALLPSNINVISQGEIVADRLQDYLSRHPEIEILCTQQGTCTYLTTESPLDFNTKATIFLGHEVQSEKVELDHAV